MNNAVAVAIAILREVLGLRGGNRLGGERGFRSRLPVRLEPLIAPWLPAVMDDRHHVAFEFDAADRGGH
jgi:hypothetical protein